MENFDDEQLADEKSIANMKIKYAGLNMNKKVVTLSKEQDTLLFQIGRFLKRAENYFECFKSNTFGQTKKFFEELKTCNSLDFEDLKNSFSELKDLEKQNPEFFDEPQSILSLNRQMARNEIFGILKLFDLFLRSADEEKKLLERIIKRRIEALGMIFLNPNQKE